MGERLRRVLQVVEPDDADDPGPLDCCDGPSGITRGRGQRFFAVDVLAGLRGGDRHLGVQVVGGRDVDHVDAGV